VRPGGNARRKIEKNIMETKLIGDYVRMCGGGDGKKGTKKEWPKGKGERRS